MSKSNTVMPGLVPGIDAFAPLQGEVVDGTPNSAVAEFGHVKESRAGSNRLADEPGHDEFQRLPFLSENRH
jgi:hypothetical protein